MTKWTDLKFRKWIKIFCEAFRIISIALENRYPCKFSKTTGTKRLQLKTFLIKNIEQLEEERHSKGYGWLIIWNVQNY